MVKPSQNKSSYSYVDAHNGGALVFAPFSVRGSPIASAVGRNRRLVRAVAVGPLGGADRRLVVSAIGVLPNSYTRRHEAVFAPGKESSQDTGWPLTSSGGASRIDQKVSRKAM